MLLAIDIGNSNIKYGIFDDNKLVASFRVSSAHKRTADEYGAVLTDLLSSANVYRENIDGVILSSVIPSLNYTICHMCEYFFRISQMIIGAGIKTGLNVKADNPKEVGADIIVNSVSAFRKYGGPVIVIDFGTATTFSIVTEKAELIGCVIAPGIKTSLNSLVDNTAQLHLIELDAPKRVIGRNSEECMRSGIIFGFAGLVDNIINNIKKELKLTEIKVVATGGMGEIIAKQTSSVCNLDRTLTLDGLNMIYVYNK